MASTQSCIVFFAIFSTFATSVFAKEFIVGDDKGWSLNFDYKTWATGKEFVVGDTLVFKYPAGVHNVLKVNGTGFQECTKTGLTAPLTTGNDVVTLMTPGRKWYICGVAKHCENGNMKLVIDVVSQAASPAPAPAAPTSAAGRFAEPRFYAFMAALLGTVLLLLV